MSLRLIKSTVIVSAMTSVSRVLGLVRDVVVARYFGAAAGTDAFFVAFKIPNFLRRLFAEGAFAQAFVPVLSEYKTQRTHAEVRTLLQDVAGTLGGILFLVTVLAAVAAPLVVMVFAPGFTDEPERFDDRVLESREIRGQKVSPEEYRDDPEENLQILLHRPPP
jgi:putative peptidoglycan lipid II flippase